MRISKTQYLRGLQCHKSLWRKAHGIKPDAQASDATESLFATGNEVGEYAKTLFPGGTDITPPEFDARKMLADTQAALDAGATTLYEASFSYDGIFVAADILHKTQNGWAIYEVKSASSVKSQYLDDLAIQQHVISQSLPIAKVFVLHINSKYERNGDIDTTQLLTTVDCTAEVINKQEEVNSNLANFRQLVEGDEPTIDIGPHCSSPYECDYHSQCWRHIPAQSVFDLYRMQTAKKMALYNSGVIDLKKLPTNQSLTTIQTLQVDTIRSGKPAIDTESIRSFIDSISYPISFFDFETFQNAIPRFDKQRPYMQMTFQYSLHILEQDNTLNHYEFLGDENSDPRRLLCERMLANLPTDGSIVAYNQGFEIGRIKELAKLFPDLADELLALTERFVDLIIPFRKGSYYHPKFNGSFSIKSVLPALFPNNKELDYKALAISHGGMAMDTFANLHKVNDPAQVEQIRSDLLAYCKLDTLAMVRIYEKLKSI